MKKKPLIVIVGPTASGKSDTAVEIALLFDGEVVSADSRQVYAKLDIGSGKISKEEMKGVPHHLLDVADAKKRFSVYDFKTLAEKAIQDISQRGKIPILCGGTGFYINAVVDNLCLPEVPPNQKLRDELSKKTLDELFDLLQKKDPRRAEEIDRNNPARLLRALEIVESEGLIPQIKKNASPYNTLLIGLDPDRENLKLRIKKRLEDRLKIGMVEEVEKLHQNGLNWQRLEELGLEYQYLAEYLQDKISFSEMKNFIEKKSIQYAKRQMTWFKRDDRIKWFKLKENEEIKNEVSSFLSKS